MKSQVIEHKPNLSTVFTKNPHHENLNSHRSENHNPYEYRRRLIFIMKHEFITSRDNPAVKHFIRLIKSSDYRNECGEFVCEGKTLLFEALASGAEVRTVFYDGAREMPDILHRLAQSVRAESLGGAPFGNALVNSTPPRVLKTDQRIISSISSVESCQGIVFSVKTPHHAALRLDRGTLILDGIRDPGNLGTILRTADAFSFHDIFLCGQCADIYNPKVIRSSMGAIFRINAVTLPYDEIILSLKSQNIKIYAAALCDGCHCISDADFSSPAAIVIGNEAHGVSHQFLNAADLRLIIPMSGNAESLNAAVAAGIFMWEMRRALK